ncbi:protein fuzzy homolog isoform X2 [Sagmatias obliquidens]|uniref:Protein fuzzy homolog isoform X2 n=1 Tax=Tursiops truncatus TaxID=9739 RepID=A0A6J3QFF3_TURTR|nr:protein fuzzy homolog isoform X2 [Lagenorhynchus obliquidens]XP_030705772.1 protein fuzzy homolog isoform X2 [Globicephala melas]XP_033701150.1 protein fuzzy homolog isoform X2 [Tursiops truncatus]
MGEEGTEGTVHLLCLAASSGVPLFCRSSRGGAPARQQLPFSVIGSLNGVHMFGQNLEVQLSSAKTEDTTVVWKSFHDSITLIVLSSEEGTSELRLERLLQMVFGAMVLLVGLEELTNIRNVERLKKELRASYRLIDSFLGDSELIGDLTQCVDCVVPPEGSLLQEALSGFAEAAGTAFVSLVVSGRVVAATESWWRLGMPEAVLLPWLVGSLPPQAARDYPVYLPHGSPTLLERWWQPLLDPLRACLPLGSRALPAGFPLHTDILGLLLLHLELKRCLFTVEPSGDQEPSSEQRRRLFRSFYTLVTATHFPPEAGQPEEKAEEVVHRAQVPRACYLVSGAEEPGTGWRLVALQLGPRRLLLLLSAQSPTHGLRGLATHTLHALTPLL